VSAESGQIVRSARLNVSETVEIEIRAATALSGTVQIDLSASVVIEPTVLNVRRVAIGMTVDSDGVNASTEISASSAKVAIAQADNDLMTDGSARVVSVDLATHTDRRVKVGAHGRNLTVTSVAVGRVDVLTIVVTVALSVVPTGSVGALISSVVASPQTVVDSLGIASSPLRGQT
jgi:hypothetical protein